MKRILFTTLIVLIVTQAFSDEAKQIEQLRQAVAKDIKARAVKIDQEFHDLQNDLDNADPDVRARAISSIVHSQDRRLIPVIRTLLSDPNANTRREAILALCRFHAKDAVDEVGKLISDPDPDVRHTAAEYGRQLGYKSTTEEVKRFLKDEDFPNSQSIAMHLAQTLPPKEAVLILAAFLDHKSHHLRKRAIWALRQYDTTLVKPYGVSILRLAGDPDSWVRSAVRQDEERLQSLVTTKELWQLSKHGSPETRAMAFRILDKKGEDILREMAANLQAAAPVLREAAIKTFTSKGQGPEKEIVALLDDPDRRVKSAALYAMRSLHFESAVPKLQQIFATGDRSRRMYAAEALLGMDEEGTVPG
ncbi:MAG: HEAT repeat domain-containing protein [Pirellulales bacterium]|nr:HEAT repeat domain-containing protein [Pirellulales bacterium]